MIHLNYPGASATQAFGLNNGDEVVGFYTVGSGSSAQTHGCTWTPGYGFQNIDDPNGVGATTVNGVNDHGDLVGFYTDSAGNTDGMLATPLTPEHDGTREQVEGRDADAFRPSVAGTMTFS